MKYNEIFTARLPPCLLMCSHYNLFSGISFSIVFPNYWNNQKAVYTDYCRSVQGLDPILLKGQRGTSASMSSELYSSSTEIPKSSKPRSYTILCQSI